MPSWWGRCSFEVMTELELSELLPWGVGSARGGGGVVGGSGSEVVVHRCPVLSGHAHAIDFPADLVWLDRWSGVVTAWERGGPPSPGLFASLHWEALARVSLPLEMGSAWAPGTEDELHLDVDVDAGVGDV